MTLPLIVQQRPARPRRGQLVVAAAAGHQQHWQQAVQRRTLLLGTAAMLAAPWLAQGQPALAQDFECDPQAGPSGIKWCDIATGFGAPAVAGGPSLDTLHS